MSNDIRKIEGKIYKVQELDIAGEISAIDIQILQHQKAINELNALKNKLNSENDRN